MGGGGRQTTETTQSLPPEVAYWSNRYLNALGNLVMPGGKLGQSPLPYQAVAPESPQQLQAAQLVSGETYGPKGAPSSPGYNTQALMNSVAGTPYWQQQLAQNPMTANAFSLPALQQMGIPGMYG